LSYNFQTVLPGLAKLTFHGTPWTFGLMYSLMSVGSVVGALFVAHRMYATRRVLVASAGAFGVALLAAAAAPHLPLEIFLLMLVGGSGIMFVSTANGLLQMHADPQMQGRVMALYSVAFLGSTAIGGPIVGWINDLFNPRAGLALGGVAALGTALVIVAGLRIRSRAGTAPEAAPEAVPDAVPVPAA
jgi:MFS family permease